MFDETLFQEFVLRCVGITHTPQMEKAIRIEKKIEKGKKFGWRFNPKIDKVERENTYVFKNSSGNPINNDKNKKIDLTSDKTCESDEDYDDEDDEDSQISYESDESDKNEKKNN